MEPHTEATPAPPLASSVPLPPPRPAAEDSAPPQQQPPQQQPQPQPPPTAHTASTADRGSFCLAVCACGWTGPARRSRDLARKDAARHATE
ncbi:hypothetical protein [Streptomyces sp. NPDC048269]|uniref:hypothetical protein n=1 Tax=Streptomyces sp. NPDC048269 TaxID=3155753 RepID=UPI0034284F42